MGVVAIWAAGQQLVNTGLSAQIGSAVSDAISATAKSVFEYFLPRPNLPALSEEALPAGSTLHTKSFLFRSNMKLSERKEIVKKAFREMRGRGILLTESEFDSQTNPKWFAQRFHQQYVCKRAGIDRVFGREVIAQAARDLNLQHIVKVPRKYAVIKPLGPWDPSKSRFAQSTEYDPTNPNLAISYRDYLDMEDIELFAERIKPICRHVDREEMEAVLKVIRSTGFSDCFGNNIMLGENQLGERGIYFIDTAYDSFDTKGDFDGLYQMMDPNDYEWLDGELSKMGKERTSKPYEEVSEPRTNPEDPFTVPIAEIL